jgi:CxxC-x17-CxxC domain-containing protein
MEEDTVEDEEETDEVETEPEITVEEEETSEEKESKVSEGEKEVDSFKREMHKAVCADCGKECEVPFKPTEGRPVYCRDCYRKHVPQRRRF